MLQHDTGAGMKKIKFMLEWGTDYLWANDADTYGTIGIDDLEISAQLKNDLDKLNRVFQATLDELYPPESGFTSGQADKLLRQAIIEEQKSLFSRLKDELCGQYDISLRLWME